MRPADVRRIFASIPSTRQVLTVNGLTYDNVHYRHNPGGVAEIINNNHRFTPFAKRLDEDGKVYVQIRVWDFDIDMIEVLDETTGTYHPMWSTDPDYTGGLSRWEHHHYQNYLAAHQKGRARQKARTSAKAKQDKLRQFDDEIYKMGIRDRAVPLALIEAEEKRATAVSAHGEIAGANPAQTADDLSWSVDLGGSDRKDDPRPPPQASRNKDGAEKRKHHPPERSDTYGLASTAELTRRDSVSPNGGETAGSHPPEEKQQIPDPQQQTHFKPRRRDNGK